MLFRTAENASKAMLVILVVRLLISIFYVKTALMETYASAIKMKEMYVLFTSIGHLVQPKLYSKITISRDKL